MCIDVADEDVDEDAVDFAIDVNVFACSSVFALFNALHVDAFACFFAMAVSGGNGDDTHTCFEPSYVDHVFINTTHTHTLFTNTPTVMATVLFVSYLASMWRRRLMRRMILTMPLHGHQFPSEWELMD
jgi:hypothetical protein